MEKSIILQVDEATAGIMTSIQKGITDNIEEKMYDLSRSNKKVLDTAEEIYSMVEGHKSAIDSLSSEVNASSDAVNTKLETTLEEIINTLKKQNIEQQAQNIIINDRLEYLSLPFFKRMFGGRSK